MPTCETFATVASRGSARRWSNNHRRAFSDRESIVSVHNRKGFRGWFALTGFALLCGAPVWAVSLATIGPAQPIPAGVTPADLKATESAVAEPGAAGSSTLVPLMAADMQARPD